MIKFNLLAQAIKNALRDPEYYKEKTEEGYLD